ncbi:ABC transporter permease [Mycoplasma feriruminatoris]|uniref:ABC transporter permease n=1 Tax=Mycoplasma feriruminatoris TaxID=1179777 RepID=A0AAQ3DRN8_9MOLU|nr:ABC transporter permease [Mycoplasma feriruminatoris]WFQ94804.1 ABC transporter permease [Mycoplasma feriruminatoris]
MKNLYLMLKQGVKWILKFKLQLVVIVVLTFIASSILTISFTTNKRLTSAYDQVVNNQKSPKFDTTYQITVGSKAKPQKGDPLFIPIFDFVNKQYTGFKDEGYDNFNLTFNDIYGEKNLLTIATSSKEFKDAWAIKKDIFVYKDNSDDRKQIAKDQEKFDFAINDALFNTMADLLSKNDPAIRDTVIGRYTKANPNWYKHFYDSSKNIKSNWANFIKDKNKIESLKKTNPDDLKTYFYSYYAFESLSQYFFKTIQTFAQNKDSELSQQAGNDKENAHKFFYEFLFGKSSNEDKKHSYKEDYIATNENAYTLTFNSSVPTSEFNKMNFLIKVKNKDEKSQDQNFFNQLVKQGFKGILRPLQVTYNEFGNETDIKDVIQYSETQELRGFVSNSNIYSQDVKELPEIFKNNSFVDILAMNADPFANIGEKSINFYTSKANELETTVALDFPITAAFLTHHNLTAQANGYDLYIRPETIFNDPITKKTFRIVDITNKNFTNYIILDGQVPTSASEITVSKQFAKANKIEIGDRLTLGNAKALIVTGYAVDTYSFFPTSDPNVPLPKSDSGGLIYADFSTINQILGDGNSATANDQTATFNFFLIKKKDALHINNVFYDHFSVANKIRDNILAKQKGSEIQTFYQSQDFSNSWYSLNWTLYQKITFWYSLATFLTASLIALVSALAVFVGVIKSIQANSKQIGILKANGASSATISWSYVSYAVILVFIAIPLGWMAGTMLQVPFVAIFKDYFSFQTNVLTYDWYAPLTAVMIFGVLIGVFSFLVALFHIKKPVLDIIKSSKKWSKPKATDWLHKHIFKKPRFATLLMLKLTESGKKPFSLLLVLIFVGTLFVSAGIAIPSVTKYAKDNYFKKVNYDNQYEIYNSLANSPLGKDTFNFWNGHEEIDNTYKVAKDVSGNINYYEDPNSYTLSNQNSSVLPELIYKINSDQNNNAEILTPYKSFIKEYTKTGVSDLYKNLLDWASYQIGISNGKSISIGTIEQLYSYILNDADLNQRFKSDIDKIKETNLVTQPLTQFVGQLLQIIFKDKVQTTGEWKEKILNLILGYSPSFIKSYLTSDSRKTQLSFGWQKQTIIPKKDQLATIFKPKSNNKVADYSILGLDKNQQSYKLSDKQKEKLFLPTNKVQQIYQIINNPHALNFRDVYLNDKFKLYDSKTNTLTIPTIVNKNLNYKLSKYGDSIISNLSSNSVQLSYKTRNGDFNALPKQAWLYDDTDYLKTKYVNKHEKWEDKPIQMVNHHNNYSSYGYEIVHQGDKDIHYYLNPYNLDVNKFTQRQVIDIWSDKNPSNNLVAKQHDNIVDESPLFGDFVVNNDGQIIKSFIRPYYQLRNLLLFIPITDKVSWEDFALYASGWDSSTEHGLDIKKVIADLDKNDADTRNYRYPALKKLKAHLVPKSVRQAWHSVLKTSGLASDYLVIRPYDFSIQQEKWANHRYEYFILDNKTKEILGVNPPSADKSIPNILLNSVPHFYRRAVGKRKSIPAIIQLHDKDVRYVNRNLKIKLKKVDDIDIYGKAYALVDSDLANMLYGFDISRSINYDYRPFDTSKIITKGELFNTYKTTNWQKVNTKDPWKQAFINQKDTFSYSPHYYYNTIFSNSSEPLIITSSVSLISEQRIGLAILDLMNLSDYKAGIVDVDFTFETKQLLNQIAKTAIYIAVIIITAIMLCASLLIMLITDIYISQYKSFMIMLRSMGYTNTQVMFYTLGIATIFSLLISFFTTIIVFSSTTIIDKVFSANGFSIPIGVYWISVVICILLILVSFFTSLWVSTKRVRNAEPSTMLSEVDE